MVRAIAFDILKITNKNRTYVDIKEYPLNNYPFSSSNAVTKNPPNIFFLVLLHVLT